MGIARVIFVVVKYLLQIILTPSRASMAEMMRGLVQGSETDRGE